MKKKHIVDKLLSAVVIIIMLIASIMAYTTVIDFVVEEPYIDEYGCIDYNEVDEIGTEEEIIELEENAKCTENLEYVEEAKKDYYNNLKSNLLSELFMIVISIGFLILHKKKDLTKDGLVTKILNSVLLLIALGGTMGLASVLFNIIWFDAVWENILKTFGFVLWPLVFYFILNKFILSETKTTKKKTK